MTEPISTEGVQPQPAGEPASARAADARLWALIPCAGNGTRAFTGALTPTLPKQYQPLAGQPLVLHTLAAFAGVSRLAGTLVAVAPGDDFLSGQTSLQAYPGTFTVPCGGPSRAETVLAGLQALQERGAASQDWVLVHDAARCLVTTALVDALIDACLGDGVGGLLAHKVADTLKSASAGPGGVRVAGTVDRSDKWLAQTPQMFRLEPLRHALAQLGAAATDEASAMEAMGLRPRLVAGGAQNFKVTYPEDFALAEAVLIQRLHGATVERFSSPVGQAAAGADAAVFFHRAAR